MKLLILSRAPYGGDRTKTGSNVREIYTNSNGQTSDTQGTEVIRSNKREDKQKTNQERHASHRDGLTELTSTRDNLINHNSTVYSALNNPHDTKSYDKMYQETQPTAFTGDASDALPLDLSGFKKTSSSSHCCSPESIGISESPLDLSVKSRKSVADSTGVSSDENFTFSRQISCENQYYRNSELCQIYQKVVKGKDNVSDNTRIDKRVENNTTHIRNGIQRVPDNRLVKPEGKRLKYDYYAQKPQNIACGTPVLFTSDRSSQKVLFRGHQPNTMVVPSSHQHRFSEVSQGNVNRTELPRKRPAMQNHSASDHHSLRVSPHPVLTPSPSLPRSPYSASASSYLSPRNVFPIPMSPGLCSASGHAGIPNRKSVLHELKDRIGKSDKRSHMIQSYFAGTKSSVLCPANAPTSSNNVRSQPIPSGDAQLPTDVDKHSSVNQQHSSLYFSRLPRYRDRETRRSTNDVTAVNDIERSSRDIRPEKWHSPPNLSMMSAVKKPVHIEQQSPTLMMPVLSLQYKIPPTKPLFSSSVPPPLISFGTQTKSSYHNNTTSKNDNSSRTQFEPCKEYFVQENNKIRAFPDGHIGSCQKNAEPFPSEHRYGHSGSHKSKSATGMIVSNPWTQDSNGKTNITDHFRMNPFHLGIPRKCSENYQQQLLSRGRRTEHTRGPENRPSAPASSDIENRKIDSRIERLEDKCTHTGTNVLLDLDSERISIQPKPGFDMKIHQNISSLMKDSIHSNLSSENAQWNELGANTDRQIYGKQQSSAFSVGVNTSIGNPVQENNKLSVNSRVQKRTPTEKLVKFRYRNDNISVQEIFNEGNSISDRGNLHLPLMIHGQVSLNQNHPHTFYGSNSLCEKENSVNLRNNHFTDLTESYAVTSKPTDKTSERNNATKTSEINNSTDFENSINRYFDQETKTGTKHNHTSAIIDSCEKSKGDLEDMSIRKTNEQRSNISAKDQFNHNSRDHNFDHNLQTAKEYNNSSVILDSCGIMSFGIMSKQRLEVVESNQKSIAKESNWNSALSVNANDKICNDHSGGIPTYDVNNIQTNKGDNGGPGNTPALSSQPDLNKMEQIIPRITLNKDFDFSVIASCHSPQSKGILSNSHLSANNSTGYKEGMRPFMKKAPRSLDKGIQRQSTEIHPRSQTPRSNFLENETKRDHNDMNPTANGEILVQMKVNKEKSDTFDFCESENESEVSHTHLSRFRSIKRFSGNKRTLDEIGDGSESLGNSKKRPCKLLKRQGVRMPDLVKAIPKCDVKQKKRKENGVYQQIEAVGRRKRKYQSRDTILPCRFNDHNDGKYFDEPLDGRRPRKRYHKNEAYEEELAREECRKVMLRVKRRQQQQEDDKPDDFTLCAKGRQRQQEHDNPNDVTLCAKRRQRQKEHNKPSLYPDEVIASKNAQKRRKEEASLNNNVEIIHRKRTVGRPRKNVRNCSRGNEVKVRRPVGRPRKSPLPNVNSKSKIAQKLTPKSKSHNRPVCETDVNQEFVDAQTDQLLGNESVTQEGVSDDMFHLPVYIKDEMKDDVDFADDATIIYETRDLSEEIHSEECTESLSVPPDLKRLQVNKNIGETVLHRAARLDYEDVIVYCLETGLIDVNVKDHGGYTALHECCVRGNLEVAKRLIAYGAKVNSSAQDGTRPIHDAVACNRVEMVRLLLSSGADPTLATYSGRTCAKIAHTKEMKEFLRGYESDLNDRDLKEVCWEFHGSSIFETGTGQGFHIFGGVPPDDDVMNSEPHFDSSSQPHLPAYTLKLDGDESPLNYHLLRDVLENMQMNRNEFFNLCGNVSFVTMTCDVFNRHVEHSQLLVSPWQHNVSGNDSKRNIEYVELVRLNDNLRKHLCITKDTLSTGLASKKLSEHVNDSVVSVASCNNSISGEFNSINHHSGEIDLFPFLCDPEMESESRYERGDSQIDSNSVSMETPKLFPDHLSRDSANVYMEYTNSVIEDACITSVGITTTTKTFSHTGGNNTASISPMKGFTLKLTNTSRGCFRDSNVSGSNNPTSDRHRSSPATGEDACTLKVAQECMMRDSIIGNEFQAQQPKHSAQHNQQQQI